MRNEDQCQKMIKCLVDKYQYVRINQLRRFARYYGCDKSFASDVFRLKNSGRYCVEGNVITLRKVPSVSDHNMISNDSYRIAGLEKAFVVFTDFFIKFGGTLFAHFPTHEFPFVLVFATEEIVYEVLYIKSGKEGLAEQILAHRKDNDGSNTRRIVIVDDEQQMDRLQIPLTCCYTIVDANTGVATYYTDE